MLRGERLCAGYGSAQVLFDVDLHINAGEVVALLGRNGVGKTTCVRVLMGLLPLWSGRVFYDDQEMTLWPPYKIARAGLGLVPEGRHIFTRLSVEENLIATAANPRQVSAPWSLHRIYDLFPRLGERKHQSAQTLSGGEQQMLSIARALMINPSLLILDEATEGLAPLMRRDIWACVRELKTNGQSILIVDRNLDALMALADRHYILARGHVQWSGTSQALAAHDELVKAHIGL
jgi:branched-chain amino acid transport system ATP-binding protein